MTSSYTSGPSAKPLLGETIGANLDRTAERVPDTEALVVRHQGLRYTYAELNDAVNQIARGLLGLNIEVGERIGIWSPNYAEWVLLQYA
ncbi:MAG TPA: AMP-binding protein, partial [Acidimicrobiales bacterium]|nr:AMP-binding protein [Acidimicrobiales bacterium]